MLQELHTTEADLQALTFVPDANAAARALDQLIIAP